MTVRVSMLLKSRASPDMLPFSLGNKKRLAIWHMNRPPLSNDTIDTVLQHREVCRAKELSSPLVQVTRKYCVFFNDTYATHKSYRHVRDFRRKFPHAAHVHIVTNT